MFNLSEPFKAKIIAGTDKTCTVNYPSNEDWCKRVRSQKTIRRSLGRKKSEYDVQNTRVFDSELFGRIRIDKDGPQFDEYEASAVIDRLDRSETIECERDGRSYRIVLKVYGGHKVVHTLRIASLQETEQCAGASGKVRFDGRNTETRSFLEPAGELYDKLFEAAEGYAFPEEAKAELGRFDMLLCIPINHKATALTEMFLACAEAAAADDEDPED